jgi:hypothetical protein
MVKHRWSEAAGAWEEAGKVEDEGEESEEDEAMTEEQRKARQYRKRKAAPWFKPQTEKKIEKVRSGYCSSIPTGQSYPKN